MSKEIGRTGITVSTRGRLLKGGRSVITPVVDEKTGYLVFQVPDAESPSRLRNEFLHVHVFCVHGEVDPRKRLGPDDVRHIDGNKKNPAFSNLELSESGMKKVYGDREPAGTNQPIGDSPEGPAPDNFEKGRGNDPGNTGEPLVAPGETGSDSKETHPDPAGSEMFRYIQDQAPASAEEHQDSDNGSGPAADGAEKEAEETIEDHAAAEPAEEAEAEVTEHTPEPDQEGIDAVPYERTRVTAVKSSPNSNYYDVLDSNGKSVLDEWNSGKKVNGATRVEQLADEHGYDVNFK